jgi:hypothetical protein
MPSKRRCVSDTDPALEKVMIERIRQMSAAEKFHRIGQMNRFLEDLALAEIHRRYPDADEQECRMRLASRRVPAELLQKAFGWNVKERGY